VEGQAFAGATDFFAGDHDAAAEGGGFAHWQEGKFVVFGLKLLE